MIVILGAAVWASGEPSPTLRRRTNAAATLWQEGGFAAVIPSGGVGRCPPAEAEVMRALLLEAGVPSAAIRLEPRATTTAETARNVSALVPTETPITAVTDGYHAARTRLAFRAMGRRVAVRTTHGAEPAQRRWLSLRYRLREAVALPYYALRLYGPRIGRRP